MELIPALRSLGISLIPYSPLHAGLLAGVLETVAEGGISDDSTLQRIEAHRDQLEAYEGLCRDLGAKPADVALAWLLRNPVVSTTIVGATTTEELRSDLGACRCSWTPRSRNDSTRSGLDQGKPRRRTPGKADPRYLARAPCSPDKAASGNPGAILRARRHERPLPTRTLPTVAGSQARSLTATAYEVARLVATYGLEVSASTCGIEPVSRTHPRRFRIVTQPRGWSSDRPYPTWGHRG